MLTFGTGVGLTLALSILIFALLKKPLDRVLVELCGKQERAEFWSVFSGIILVLVPVGGALVFRPSEVSPVFNLANQMTWALTGLVGSVLTLGWVLGRFITRSGR